MIDGTAADTLRLAYCATKLRYLAGQAKVVTLGLQSLVAEYGVADYCTPGIARTGELDTVATATATLLDAIAAESTDADNTALQMVTDAALGALCIETAKSVDSKSAQDFWDSLTDQQREDLIANSPEVVINSLLAAGVELSPAELADLEAAEAHAVLSDEYWAKVGGSVTLKYCTVKVSKDVSLQVQKMSDGSVLVTVVDHSEAGISPPSDDDPNKPKGPVDVSLTALAGAGSKTTFRFGSEHEAVAAVSQIRRAATGVVDALRPRQPSDVLKPWKQWKRVGSALTGDDVEQVLATLADRLDRIEVSTSTTQSASVKLSDVFAKMGVNASASAERELKFYRSEQIHGGDDYTAARLTLAGGGATSVSQKALTRLGIPSEASVDGSVSIEARAMDDGTMYLNVSAAGAYATGASAGKANVGASSMSGKKYTLDVKVPITAENAARVQQAVGQIASGTGLGDALDAVYDEADITITTTTTTSTAGAVKAGSSKVMVGAQAGKTSSANEVRRKRRNGDWYSQTEAQDRLDEAQQAPCEVPALP